MKETYAVAIYLRISSDDGFHGDSQSIEGQRDLLTGFIRNHPVLANASIREFSDDGYSGTNFNRPGVMDLLKQVRSGEIHCIVVKDFSRFGRNYIEVGDYIEQVFPFLRVRFLSVNDGYDSAVQGSSVGDVSIAFKHLCNDYYCKDLSRKVRAGFKSLRESGKYLSSYAVYGYSKDPEDKNHLIIDKATAPIVRRIFDMAISGIRPSQIATALNADGIMTPMVYLSRKKDIRTWSKLKNIWTDVKVINIIRDLRYTGAVVGGLYAVDGFGSHRVHKTPKSEWIIREGMHQPLVSKEEYEKAQFCVRKLNRKASGPRQPSPHSLPVKVRCGGCGHAMVKNGAKVMAYYCRYRNTAASDACYTGKIEVDRLRNILLTAIQGLQYAVLEQIKTASESTDAAFTKGLSRICSLQREIQRLKKEKQDLYDRHNEREISRDEFIIKKNAADTRLRELALQVEALETKNAPYEANKPSIPPALAFLQDATQPLEYSNEIVKALVDCVIVHDDYRVEIRWKFADTILPATLKEIV